MDELALSRANQLQQLPWVPAHRLWNQGAAEPLGPTPEGVDSAQEPVERCLLL